MRHQTLLPAAAAEICGAAQRGLTSRGPVGKGRLLLQPVASAQGVVQARHTPGHGYTAQQLQPACVPASLLARYIDANAIAGQLALPKQVGGAGPPQARGGHR